MTSRDLIHGRNTDTQVHVCQILSVSVATFPESSQNSNLSRVKRKQPPPEFLDRYHYCHRLAPIVNGHRRNEARWGFGTRSVIACARRSDMKNGFKVRAWQGSRNSVGSWISYQQLSRGLALVLDIHQVVNPMKHMYQSPVLAERSISSRDTDPECLFSVVPMMPGVCSDATSL
jgi:hypothetical protein